MTTRLRRLLAAASTLLLVSVVFVVGAENLEESAHAAEPPIPVTVFNMPGMNGIADGDECANENANLLSIVDALPGYSVDGQIVSFGGSAWTGGGTRPDTATTAFFKERLYESRFFVMPDMESSTANPSNENFYPPAARTIMREWVEEGNVLVMTGLANAGANSMLNVTFSDSDGQPWAITRATGSSWEKNSANTAGTPFEDVKIDDLPNRNATDAFNFTDSNVENVKVMWGTESNAVVAVIEVGAGYVIWLGFDFYDTGASGVAGVTDYNNDGQRRAIRSACPQNNSRWVTQVFPAALDFATELSASGAGQLEEATTSGGRLDYELTIPVGTEASDPKAYFVIVPSASPPPDAVAIKGADVGGLVAAGSSNLVELKASFTVTGLSSATDYSAYIVSEYTNDGNLEFSAITSVDFSTLPEPPALKKVTPGNEQVVLEITQPPRATNFQYSLDGGENWFSRSPQSSESPWIVVLPENGTFDSMKVRAVYKGLFSVGVLIDEFTAAGPPLNQALPTIEGIANSGNTLNANIGTWLSNGAPLLATSYQWNLVADEASEEIVGATAQSFCVPNSNLFVGAALTVTVTQTNAVGSSSETSLPTAAITQVGTCVVTQAPTPAAPTPPRPTAAPVLPPVVQAPVTVPGRTTPVAPAPAPAPVTGPVLRGNVVPTAPQQPVARVGTRDIPVTTQVNTPNRLDVRASSVSLGVSIPQTVGGVRQQAGGPTELEVRSGGQTTLQGGGVLARSTVQVFMPLQGDNAKQIAQIEADATGTFNGDAVFATQRTEAPLPIGRQVLQIVSLDDTGQQVVMEMAVVIAQPPPAPEFDRSVDALPTLPPGQSIATEAGLPVQVAVRAETENRQAVIEADDWSMAISVAGQDASVEETPEGGASLTFVRDETASVQGSGFMPGTRADVWLFSEPTLLGTVTIDDNGEFNGEISVDGRIVTVGEHTLQLQGVGADGYVRSANLGVVVKDADAEVATTADVAASFAWWFWIIGLFALLLVAIIAYWLYRRARQEAA